MCSISGESCWPEWERSGSEKEEKALQHSSNWACVLRSRPLPFRLFLIFLPGPTSANTIFTRKYCFLLSSKKYHGMNNLPRLPQSFAVIDAKARPQLSLENRFHIMSPAFWCRLVSRIYWWQRKSTIIPKFLSVLPCPFKYTFGVSLVHLEKSVLLETDFLRILSENFFPESYEMY